LAITRFCEYDSPLGFVEPASKWGGVGTGSFSRYGGGLASVFRGGGCHDEAESEFLRESVTTRTMAMNKPTKNIKRRFITARVEPQALTAFQYTIQGFDQ